MSVADLFVRRLFVVLVAFIDVYDYYKEDHVMGSHNFTIIALFFTTLASLKTKSLAIGLLGDVFYYNRGMTLLSQLKGQMSIYYFI